jgi:radical SAM family uncharacterized protein/radical SAM-linked protein
LFDALPPEARPALLAGLEHPARYLGTEPGAKPNELTDARGRLLTVALAFPDVYEIAHSHLGHKILYHMLNSTPGFRAERVYAPWVDLAERLEKSGKPLRSLESTAPVKNFDLVGFSLQYELAYTTILDMLSLAGINPLAAERDGRLPLVVGGGPGASNPEPLADFFDFFFLGDAEAFFLEDLEIIKDWRDTKAGKEELFDRLAGRPGIYIPSLFRPVYQGEKLKSIEPLKSSYCSVRRAVAPKLSQTPFPVCQITPFVKPVHDRVVVEIGRGCSRGCRFCQAGFLYRPVRERNQGEVLDLISENLSSTGHDQAAFLSLSAGDHTQAGELVERFMNRYADDRVALSLPSLRVRSLSGHLAEQIKRVRKTGFTLAPEAATERLRAVINKDLSEDDIFRAAETAFRLGWKTIKLYFMAGLPTESEEDLRAIVSLAARLSRLGRAKLNLGLAHFTPKAHTPFQWHPASTMETIETRLAIVKAATRHPSLAVKYNDPGISLVEGILSRGDRRLGPLLTEVRRRGARFEAWNDRFRVGLWLETIKDFGFSLEELIAQRKPGDVLPWSHLFCGVSPEYLAQELAKAGQELTTPDCRLAGCLGCGACHDGASVDLADPSAFNSTDCISSQEPDSRLPHPVSAAGQAAEGPAKTDVRCVAQGAAETTLNQLNSQLNAKPNQCPPAALPVSPGPAIHQPSPNRCAPSPRSRLTGPTPAHQSGRYLAQFAKEGGLVLLGHLEMVEIFKKSFRRAGLNLKSSQGFHPQPKLSFLTALPLGVASLDERVLFELCDHLLPQQIYQAITLPEGLRLQSISLLGPNSPKPRATAATWEIECPGSVFANPPLHPEAHLSYTGTKGSLRQFRLSEYVLSAVPKDPGRVWLTIRIAPDGTPKPLPSVRAMWGLAEDIPASLKKIATIVDSWPSA